MGDTICQRGSRSKEKQQGGFVHRILMHDGFNAVKADGVDPYAVCKGLHDECETSLIRFRQQGMAQRRIAAGMVRRRKFLL